MDERLTEATAALVTFARSVQMMTGEARAFLEPPPPAVRPQRAADHKTDPAPPPEHDPEAFPDYFYGASDLPLDPRDDTMVSARNPEEDLL